MYFETVFIQQTKYKTILVNTLPNIHIVETTNTSIHTIYQSRLWSDIYTNQPQMTTITPIPSYPNTIYINII